jgi:hypothetical protein
MPASAMAADWVRDDGPPGVRRKSLRVYAPEVCVCGRSVHKEGAGEGDTKEPLLLFGLLLLLLPVPYGCTMTMLDSMHRSAMRLMAWLS